ncbi:AAA family ATPase [Spirosoma areae]
MLINSLGLKNFKCFEELDVKFAPITILTGANSSGKSSLIYAILAVLQTEQFPFYLSPNGKYVNMGSFEEVVLGKDIQKNISIKFSIRSNYFDELYYNTTWKGDSGGLPVLHNLELKNKRLELSINMNSGNYSVNLSLFSQHKNKKLPEAFILTSIKGRSQDEFIISTEGNLIFNNIKFPSADKMIRTFLLPILEDFRNYSIGGIGVSPYALQLYNFNYIGSFRLPPERTYYQKTKAEAKISSSGEGYIDQIMEWEVTDPKKLNELNLLLKDLQLFDEIQSNKSKGGRFELNIKTPNSALYNSLVDVGFGISQFLPIIVADLQLSDQSCLAISQPEIHLHPKIQAQFGNYLSNQIKKTQKQYIVETHSEYLLNRIRLLLVTGELKPEDVRVLYFENDGVKSTVHDVEFATDGQIKGAPQGFFDTYGLDVMNIAMNAVA